jgi:hypothetical protein
MGLGHRYREQLLECFVTGFAGFLLHTNQLNATRLVASTMQLHLIVASHILFTLVWCGGVYWYYLHLLVLNGPNRITVSKSIQN